MKVQQRAEILVGEHIPILNQECLFILEKRLHLFEAACRAQECFLQGIAQRQLPLRAITKVSTDGLRHEVQVESDPIKTLGLEVTQEVSQQRMALQGQHRFSNLPCEVAQTSAQTGA